MAAGSVLFGVAGLFIFSIITPGQSLSLPSYVKGCSRNDPNIDECALKSGREALNNILKGDKKYRIPNYKPLRITQIVVDQGSGGSVGLRSILNDVAIYGLDKTVVNAVRVNISERRMEFDLNSPINLQAKYNISGKILVLPIVGNGDMVLNLTNVHSVYKFHYDLENSKSDGKEYIKLGGESTFVFEPESFHIEMTNLFNGDQNLGDNMNRFMNENWRDVLKELGPVVGDAFRKTLDILIDQFLGLVPYDDVFPIAE